MDTLYPDAIKVAFRVHLKDTDIDTVHNKLKTYKYHSGHIVAYELDAERPHYQGYYILSNKDNNLQMFRKWLKRIFNLEGNGDYSLSKVRNSDDYKKYIIKEHNWRQSGFDVQRLTALQLISYPKKKKFQEELDELEIRFLQEDMDYSLYLFEFFKLKGKYRQVINTNYAKQRLLMLISRKDDKKLLKISQNIAQSIKEMENNIGYC